MSEENTEELQAEIDRLRSKNTELLKEKKQTAADAAKWKEQAESQQAELDKIADAPVMEVFETLSPDANLTAYLKQEFGRYFKVVKDDGELMLHDIEDKPVKLDGKAAVFNVETVHKLVDSGEYNSLLPLLKAKGTSGGGASSSGRTNWQDTQQEKPAKPLQFGLK